MIANYIGEVPEPSPAGGAGASPASGGTIVAGSVFAGSVAVGSDAGGASTGGELPVVGGLNIGLTVLGSILIVCALFGSIRGVKS